MPIVLLKDYSCYNDEYDISIQKIFEYKYKKYPLIVPHFCHKENMAFFKQSSLSIYN